VPLLTEKDGNKKVNSPITHAVLFLYFRMGRLKMETWFLLINIISLLSVISGGERFG
jgi:hypothetical protein